MMARNRWLKTLVEETGADAGLLAAASMGDISPNFEGDLELCLGDRFYPVTPRMKRELRRWRRLLNLPDEVMHGERHPLIQLSLRDPGRLTRRQARAIAARLTRKSRKRSVA